MDVENTFDVVISGIGGHFPECNDVETLMEKLQLGESLITLDNRRWKAGQLGVDAHTGKVLGYKYFDNQFFGIHRPLTLVMDPMGRILLERVVEAVMDAGLHPFALSGSNTSVYSSCCISQHEMAFMFTDSVAEETGFGIMGRSRSMTANRISFFLNLKGRSCAYDGTWACAASGLQMAYNDIMSGECDSAIVACTSLAPHAEVSFLYSSMDLLSPDGVSRPFDADGKGIVRSESIVALLLQRSDRAKRAYAKVLGASMMFDGDVRRDLISPSVGGIAMVVGNLYKDMGIDTKRVKYVECDGTGYQPTDYAEVEGLSAVLCKGREDPLLIGSVKGNVGHTEGASGMLSIVKAICVLRNSSIPRTLNTKKINPKIPSLKDGRLQVVLEDTPIAVDDDTVLGLTFTSYSGSVGHVALGAGSRDKETTDPFVVEIPRLILACARSEEEIQRILKKISNVPFDPEYYRLVQDIFADPVRGYECRGHVVCPSIADTPFNIQIGGKISRPVWFVFSGMGSQWPQMGRDLLRLPVFAATIDRCHAVLESKGLNLRQILTYPKQDIFDNILHSFVGIAAVQVGLINIMRLLEIEAEGFIGHSVGEQACAYADGCFSEEQTILSAYARGVASNEAKLIKGMMASVGIGYNSIKDQLPESIEVACHNSNDNCTISGPVDDVNEFVESLKKNDVFARAVNVSNTAYHSRYVKDAGPILMRRLSEVIKDPKERSSRWISTSSPEELWGTTDARFCSPRYFTNNLLRPVLFEEAMKHVPEDVILIEIAPHGLLQAILRRSSPPGTTNISLTKRGAADGLLVLYDAIGKMYLEGLSPKVANLYPKIEFPVSRQTPSTADLASWLHTEEFYSKADTHFRLVWTFLLNLRHFGTNQQVIQYQDIWYLDPLTIQEGGKEIHLTIQPAIGVFEIMDDTSLIITGRVLTCSDEMEDKEENPKNVSAALREKGLTLTGDHVYAELAGRGNSFRKDMMPIKSIETSEGVWIAKVRHGRDIDAVFAAIFQLVQLHGAQESQVCTYPKFLKRLKFDPKDFFTAYPEVAEMTFFVKLNRVVATGLTLEGLNFRPLQIEAPKDLKLQASSLKFIPYGTKSVQSTEELASVALQLAIENQPTPEIIVTILELSNGTGNIHKEVGDTFRQMASDYHNAEVNITKMSINGHGLPEKLKMEETTISIILCGASTASAAVSLLKKCPSAMILAYLKTGDNKAVVHFRHLAVLAGHGSDSESYLLLRELNTSTNYDVIMVPKTGPVPQSINVSMNTLYVWHAMPVLEIRRVVDEIANIPGGGMVRMVFILDKNAPEFSTSHPLYSKQLALGVRLNILHGGVWGSFKVMPLPPDSHQTPNGRNPLYKVVSVSQVEGTHISHWGLEEVTVKSMSQELGLDYCGKAPHGHICGVAKATNGVPLLDRKLQWSVPEGWTPEDATTIPLAYCQAYYALHCCANMRPNDVVLVTEPLRPEGQAAVRVALASEQSSEVFIIARSESDSQTLTALFCDAVGARKLRVIQINYHTIYDIFVRDTKLRGRIDVIVTFKPEDVKTDVLSMLSRYGRCVHLGSAQTTLKHQIGLSPFNKLISMFCVSAQSILHMKDNYKQMVHTAIDEGLKPSGFVRPLLRMVQSTSATVHGLWKNEDAIGKKLVLRVRDSDSPTVIFKTGSTCLLTNATPQQTIFLANWSARHGITNIVVHHAQPQDAYIRRHEKLLQSAYGATMQIAEPVHDGIEKTLAIIFVVADDEIGRRSAETLTKKSATVPLVVLSADETNYAVLEESCAARRRTGSRTLLLLGRMEHAVDTRVLDWLLKAEDPPPITLLRSRLDAQARRIPAARLLKLLPQGAESLAVLGRSFLQQNQAPSLVDIPTHGPNHLHAREVFPLIAVPGFAASIDRIIRPLAKKLLVPLVCVRLPGGFGNVVDVARDVAKVIQGRQRTGPYTLLGFDWTVCLTQQIAVELGYSGNKVTILFVDGNTNDAQEVSRLKIRPDVDDLLLSECLNLQINTSTYAEVRALSTWEEKIHHLCNLLGDTKSRIDVERALNIIRQWIEALSRHQITSCDVETHLIETSSPEEAAFLKSPKEKVFRCIETHNVALSTDKALSYINENMAYPSLQTIDARTERGSYLY